jgi:hypothetical protein
MIQTQSLHGSSWIQSLGDTAVNVDGLVRVAGYEPDSRPPEEVLMVEKAATFGAYAVFFEAGSKGQPDIAQAFVYVSDGPANDPDFAALHKRLWSWGGVPLLYRRTQGLVQLFRCAHKPDFVSKTGDLTYSPIKTLRIAAAISTKDAWWDAERLRNGTLWDDPAACKLLLSASKSAHRRLVDGVKDLHETLRNSDLLNAGLRRRLLILSLLIAYLEERGALLPGFFGEFRPGATRFFNVLADGPALVRLLAALEDRFNGCVFSLTEEDRRALEASSELGRFSRLIEAHEEVGGQLNLWALYSFRDLPIEVISHIYQLFVTDIDNSVYTPPPLVRLMLDEALSWPRVDRLVENGERILDPACGSGVFLVEAYKRLVLHWRSRNGWVKPDVTVLRGLLDYVRGVDVEPGAIELAAFSLCLALCDALEPEEIRASVKLFPQLAGRTLLQSCFFEAKEKGLIEGPVGVVVGNPPFESALKTEGAKRSYDRYVKAHGKLADKQVAYLFLHESMEVVAEGGVLSMLQQHNLLYNQSASSVRRTFFERWDVREVLDFVSIRGLFQKGGADTKIVAIVAVASTPSSESKILHAVFRRGGRTDAEQGFDIDYYDLHWLPRRVVLEEVGAEVWRANLLGGARTFSLLKRLRALRTLKQYAREKGWLFREGFVEGASGVSRPAAHIIGRPLLPSAALTLSGVDRTKITTVPQKPIEGPRTRELFTPPILLVREVEDLPHAVWDDGYLTFKNQIVGFTGGDPADLKAVDTWLTEQAVALRAFVAGVSGKLFTQKATNLAEADILALPFPEGGSLDLSENERIVAQDVVDHYRQFVRLGSDAGVARADGEAALPYYTALYCSQINAVYRDNPVEATVPQRWPGIICQPFAFGGGQVDWSDATELRGKLDYLLRHQRSSVLAVTRIARIYDANFVFILKPDRLRYWLRSTALRDADDTLADLRAQGF